jgi:hypothetical protein
LIFGKLIRVHNYDYTNRATIKFEESVGNKVKKPRSSGTIESLKENLLEWLKYKHRRMESDSFDEFLFASKDVGNSGSLIVMFNHTFMTKVSGNWYRNTRFVESNNFTIVNETQEYSELWDKLLPDKEERYRALELSGARMLFKGRRVTGLTFTRNDADLISKKCYVLDDFCLIRIGQELLNFM